MSGGPVVPLDAARAVADDGGLVDLARLELAVAGCVTTVAIVPATAEARAAFTLGVARVADQVVAQ